MRNLRGIAILCGLLVTGAVTHASAHEFWVEPSAFAVERGGPIGVRLCIGDGYEGWSQARNPARIESFAAVGSSGMQPVVGLDGADPAGTLRLAAPGDYVIVYRSNNAFTEMPAAAFDAYLRDKGLDRIIAARASRPLKGLTVREAYSRHAKALVRVGAGAGIPSDRVMRLPLELVAEADATDAPSDGWHRFRLLHQGRPLAGSLVAAARPGTSDEPVASRTDLDGRVRFRLPEAGRWRIAAVHMDRAPRGIDADYESLWASLTFELPARGNEIATQSGAACRNRVAEGPALVSR